MRKAHAMWRVSSVIALVLVGMMVVSAADSWAGDPQDGNGGLRIAAVGDPDDGSSGFDWIAWWKKFVLGDPDDGPGGLVVGDPTDGSGGSQSIASFGDPDDSGGGRSGESGDPTDGGGNFVLWLRALMTYWGNGQGLG